MTTAALESQERAEVSFTLAQPEAQRLREVLPWLVKALEDRTTLSPKQRERRRETRAAIAVLMSRLDESIGPPAAAPTP